MFKDKVYWQSPKMFKHFELQATCIVLLPKVSKNVYSNGRSFLLGESRAGGCNMKGYKREKSAMLSSIADFMHEDSLKNIIQQRLLVCFLRC